MNALEANVPVVPPSSIARTLMRLFAHGAMAFALLIAVVMIPREAASRRDHTFLGISGIIVDSSMIRNGTSRDLISEAELADAAVAGLQGLTTASEGVGALQVRQWDRQSRVPDDVVRLHVRATIRPLAGGSTTAPRYLFGAIVVAIRPQNRFDNFPPIVGLLEGGNGDIREQLTAVFAEQLLPHIVSLRAPPPPGGPVL